MAIRGKVYIVPDPDKRAWRLVAHNEGDSAFAVTQNILPANDPGRDQHDDHGRYGHGLLVSPSRVSTQLFEEGGAYHDYTITEGCHIRVGLRGLAYKTVELPPLDNGAPLELDLADFVWYGGTPDASVPKANNWAGSAEHRPDAPDGADILAQIEVLIAQANNGIKCEGRAKVSAVEGPGGELSHWEVWFENQGDQAWIGTVSFCDAQKNDGIGLESMGCPGRGQAAMQRIEAMGNYGEVARPGAKVRLGVRGYAWKEVELPASGELELPLKKFKVDTSSMADEYFDPKAVEEKRNEKRDRVQFFDDGKPLNDALTPKVWRGDEALARSTYDAPNFKLWAVKDGPQSPGGGWMLEVENTLPQTDDKGLLGFVAVVKLGAVGFDPKSLPPRRFDFPGQAKRWFIPKGLAVGDQTAEAGTVLHLSTRGLGWVAELPLPRSGSVDSSKPEVWGFREDQYHRRHLSPSFTNLCRK